MTRIATATRTTASESSSLTTSSSSSVASESSTESTVSVIPPAYMSTSESLDTNTPDYSSIDQDQSSYCSSMSEGLESVSMPESENFSSADNATDEVTATEETESTAEEESSESGEGGEGEEETAAEEEATSSESEESSEEEGGEEEATEEEAVEEEEGEGEEGESEEESEGGESAAGGGGGSGEEEAEGIEAIVTKLPRMTPIRTPYVASAPPQAIERRDEIIKRTGSPPDLHHAKVRQNVELVAQAARDAQRRMVWAIGNIAKDTRISIEEMADEIMAAASAAVAQINGAINTAMTDIELAAVERMDYLDESTILTGEELEANRDFTNQAIATELMAGSESVTALNDVATESFDGYVEQGAEKIRAIPGQGDVEAIPAPTSSSGGGESSDSGGGEGEAPDYQIMADADIHLQEFLTTQSGIVGQIGPQSSSYYGFRAAPVLEGMEARTETQLDTNAEEKATNLGSDANRAQFLIMLLGLTTPVSKYHENDQTEAEQENERELLSQMTEAEAAHYRANQTIMQKCEMAKEYADRDLRENLTDNIWKAGRKGAQGLRKQAATAEVTLNNAAVPMAEAYRDLVARLTALLPPGQFLDSREIIPKVLAAREQAIQLQAQHEATAKEQALATEAQMEEVKKQQVDGLFKAASDSMQNITDVVTQTSFDMELFVMQMTGSMRVGAGACMTAAQEYANRTAEGILNSINGTSGPGMDRINSVAVGFVNGQISMAEQAQFQQLSGFVETMEETGENGPLTKPMFDAQSDLHTRSTALDNAMPERSTGTAIALGVVSPVAMGVYLYCTDPSEDTVVTQLGGLMWPGILALEEVFELDQGHGSLQGRIRDRLDDPEKSNALGLFSTSAEVRADARMDIVNNSTHWYSDYNRETREAVLSGMSAGERGTLDPAQLDEVRQTITEDLDVHQRDIALAYLEGNRERAVAARTHEALDKGVEDARWGWIFSAGEAQRRSDQARVDAIAGMDAMLRRELAVENAFANSMTTEELSGSTDQVYQEFASLRDPRGRSADSFTAAEGRRSMIDYATQSHTSAVLNVNPLGVVGMGPLLYATPETVNMSNEASSYIEAAVMHGGDSNEARSARGVYEIAAARREGGSPSETTQTRLSDALENRTLATLEREVREARTPQERSRAERRLAEERANHRARLQEMARGLGAPEDVVNDPAAAEAWMSNQVGSLFAETDSIFQTGPSHRRYGEEMITMGRASLDATVALATDGWGTHDDLLTRGYTDRSHAEIDAANARWSREHGGESMEEMLGLRNGRDRKNRLRGDDSWWSGFGAETSGDQTMGLEILAMGNPENDMDRIAIANLRYEHQRVRGTGFIAERSMAGTDEQLFLDRSRADMARVILAEAVSRNPELAGRFDDDPLAIFNADGSLNSDVAGAAFENGNFRGSSTELHNATAHIGYAADAYRAEIDRQESMLTTGITVLALIASIALMCIPGVNVVAAGIITAIIAGAATIAVKCGMRGERYGWEEAATDVGTTAIEVATAGIGGALAGGLGKAGMAGRLARIGDVMVARLGKVGGAIAREAIVSAVSSAASTAIQDDTWKDGLGAGLGRLANSAIRGAVVSAISTGVSEGLTAKLNTRMAVGDVDPANMTRWQKMATTLGPHGSEMIREGIANGVGTFASEAVGVVIDYAQGNFRGDFGDALKQVGLATLRETATSAIRGAVTSVNRERYRQLLDVARRGGPMSPNDYKALRLFAISAGAMNYDSDINTMRKEVDTARDLLARMPPGLREHASAMDADTLSRLMGMMESADLGDLKDADKKAEFLRELGESVPGLDARAFMAELNNAISRRAPADTETAIDPAQQNHLRTQLGSNLHEGLKFALDNVRMDGLQHLSDAELAQAAAMIASGKFNSAEADALMRAAKQRNPELDEFGFLNNLHSAVKNSESAQAALNKNADARRQGILELVPEDAAPIFRHLPDEDIALAQRLIRAGDPGTPQQQDALFRAAQTKNPELTRDQFHQFMAKAASEMRTRLTAEATAKRAAREEAMTDVPEHLRSTLSVLPEAGLVELRLRQMEGSLSPAEKVRLMDMARKANPDVDLRQLSDAIDQAVATQPIARISEAETAELRKHLVSGVPEDQRALIQNTPIMVLSDAEFIAMTRSNKGQAVTMIIDGRPVIVMREGANPRALREEGIHALQAHDPQWAKHIGSLDEQHLANWDDLPLEQQIILYRNKVALELDAQQRMIASIEADITNAKSPQEKAALQHQLEQTQLAHANLSRRMGEVGNMDAMDLANIKAGFTERPQWLDQPARLFQKVDEDGAENQQQQTKPGKVEESPQKTPEEIRKELIDALTSDLVPGGDADKSWRESIVKLDLDSLTKLANSGLEPRVAREMHKLASATPNPRQFIENLHSLSAHIDPKQLASIARGEQGDALLRALVDISTNVSPDQRAHIIKLASSDQVVGLLHGIEVEIDGTKRTVAIDRDSVIKILATSADATIAMKLMNIAANSPNSADFADALDSVFKALPESTRTDAIAKLARKDSGQAELVGELANVLKNLNQDSDLGKQLVGAVLNGNHPVELVRNMNSLLSSTDEPTRTAVIGLLKEAGANNNIATVMRLIDLASRPRDPGVDSLVNQLSGNPALLCDIIRIASQSAQPMDFLARATRIATAIGSDAALMGKLHDYMKAYLAGGSDVFFRSIQEMGAILKDNGNTITDEIKNALNDGKPLKTTRVVADTPATLKTQPPEMDPSHPDHATPAGQQKIKDFIDGWHKFMSGTFTIDGKTRPVSESYQDFVGFLKSPEGFNLTDAEINGALRAAIENLIKNGEALTVDNIRHEFKEQFKRRILDWVLHGDGTTRFDPNNPASVAESLRRLEVLSTKGLNVKDRANLAEQWHAYYREALTGKPLETQPMLREKDNPSMVGADGTIEIPSTPSNTRKPDFSDPPALGDVKSHQGPLSKEDEIRLRAYLRAVSVDGGARVVINGKLSTETFDRVNVVFTNAAGAVASSAVMARLLNDYPDRFSFCFCNTRTGEMVTVDVATLQRMGVSVPVTAAALESALQALSN